MITILLKNNGEPRVNELTYELLWKELKHIPGAKIEVVSDWLKAVPKVSNNYVCFVEPDCLVSSGYFDSLIGHMNKNPQQLNKLGVLSSATGVNHWAVKFYGFRIGNEHSTGVIPNKDRKDNKLPFYTMQVAYIPGSLIRTSFLNKVLADFNPPKNVMDDLVLFSTLLSLAFWKRNWQVYIAPNSTYVTTEDYVNDIAGINVDEEELKKKFMRESI